ncbi:MAG: two-component sensor histidine kinase, partial [Burkholderiaceae bacterium]
LTQRSAPCVSVENTGPEIPADFLPRVFDRFARADKARSHGDADGAGLGLAITRAIAVAHGGQISAESAGGRTRFTLRFPGRP